MYVLLAISILILSIICILWVKYNMFYGDANKMEYYSPNDSNDSNMYSNVTSELQETGSANLGINKGTIALETISSGIGLEASLLYAPCDARCCSSTYPTTSENEYVANPYSCSSAWNNGKGDIAGAGCMCMTNEQREYLVKRGGNA
jgi:hypothetical protein